MESLNRMAVERVDEAIDFAEEFDVGAFQLDNEATVIDFGLEFDGGIEAGLLLAEVQTAGLASLGTAMGELAGTPIPHVELHTDHPGLALLCSQKAGWELSVGEFEGLGSGPARALVAREEEFALMEYVDAFDLTVLAVECDRLPGEAVAEEVADQAEVSTSGVYLAAFPTASVAGSVSVAARAAELALFRLMELGYDPADVVTATGSAPVAPVAGDERTAMGRTNDALAYGGQVHLIVEEDFDRFDEAVSSAGEEYGRPFEEVFDDADWSFDDVPRSVFAPAQVTVDVRGGPLYAHGDTDEDLLAESFGV
ncbi:methenyltetrahydromethanopterin cyclohydrolase [Halobacteriales archaeon QS_8_69_26]|nr:MAG: methenyltetrahydromethanopterin cyclohydrolase [Halobacteriales archaeon QS_8_69_26]